MSIFHRAVIKFKGPLAIILLSGYGVTFAQDRDFGKTLPSTQSIIDEFKVEPAAEQDVQGQTETGDAGFKSRGLKKIGVGHAGGKPSGYHIPIKSSVTEKAISMEVLFDYNSAELTSDAKLQLVPVGGAMASPDLKGLHYRIEGHTDVVGGDEFNIDLSRRRAESVKQFLIDQYGLAASAIEIVGKGKSGLADRTNPTSEVNRRVRIIRLSE